MKRLFKYVAILSALSQVSCSDFFEPDNSSVIFDGKENVLMTDVNASILGIYSNMQELAEPLILLGELRADMMDVQAGAPQDLVDISNLVYTESNDYLSKRPFYEIVNNCDEILGKMADVMKTDPSFTENYYLDYQAEVTGAKCWTLWQIAQLFGEVKYEGEMVSAEDVAPLLTEDLEAVRDNFMISSLSGDWLRSRFNKWATFSLLGELKMAQGMYAEAILDFDAIMEIDGDNFYKLSSTYLNSNWKNIFMDFSTAQYELQFGINFNATYKQTNDLQDFADRYIKCTEGVVSDIFAKADSYRTSSTFDGDEILKYSIAVNKATPIADYVGATPVLIYRAANVHLLYAECYNRLGDAQTALQYINTGDVLRFPMAKGVRGRVGLGRIEADVDLTAGDEQYLVDMMILEERGRELAFEGKRWADLVRFDSYYPEKKILESALQRKNSAISVASKYIK